MYIHLFLQHRRPLLLLIPLLDQLLCVLFLPSHPGLVIKALLGPVALGQRFLVLGHPQLAGCGSGGRRRLRLTTLALVIGVGSVRGVGGRQEEVGCGGGTRNHGLVKHPGAGAGGLTAFPGKKIEYRYITFGSILFI